MTESTGGMTTKDTKLLLSVVSGKCYDEALLNKAIKHAPCWEDAQLLKMYRNGWRGDSLFIALQDIVNKFMRENDND